MKTEFRIVGLTRRKSITCETPNQDTFQPNLDQLTQDRFDALWCLLDGHWEDKPLCIIQHDGFYSDGMPKNPIFLQVTSI